MPIEGLEFHPVDLKFTEGMDTKTNAKILPAGKWQFLGNVSLAKDNTPRRRDGILTLASSNGNGLFTHNDELLVVSSGTCTTITSATTPSPVSASGVLGYVGVTRNDSVIHSSTSQDQPDCAHGGGFTCYVWRQTATTGAATQGLGVRVVDEATGADVITPQLIVTSANIRSPRVVFADSAFFIFAYSSATVIDCYVITTANPTTVNGPTAIISSASLNTTPNFDTTYVDTDGAGTTPGVGLVYCWADGTTSVRAVKVTRSGTTPSVALGPTNVQTEVNLANANITGLTLAQFDSPVANRIGVFTVGIGATPQAGCSTVVLNAATWAVSAGPAQISATVGPAATPVGVTAVSISGFMSVFWDEISAYGTARLNAIRSAITTSTATIAGAAAVYVSSNSFRINAAEASGPQGPWIAGKAFGSAVSGPFLPVHVLENYQGTGTNTATVNAQCSFYVMANQTVVGRALYGVVGVNNINNAALMVGAPCSTPKLTTAAGVNEKWIMVEGERTNIVALNNNVNLTPSGLCRLTMEPNTYRAPSKAQLGQIAYLSGGVISQYDGIKVSNHGFLLYPEGASCVAVGGGSGSMTAGVHQVVFVYEWLDGQGLRHQSAPSIPISVTTVATGSITCLIPTLQMAGVPVAEIRVVPYMTQAAGQIFNRVLVNGASVLPLMNTTAATTVTFTITSADTDVASNEPLYNQPTQAGTTLANVAPPPCGSVCVHQNRLFINPSDAPGTYRYSQQPVNGVGLQWGNSLGGTIDSTAGGIIGFASLDEKLLIFGARKIFALFGTGPDSTGANSTYSDPVQIPSDVGCSDFRSILRMPMGVIFKSAKGWYLVGRDLVVKYIGQGVAAYDGFAVSSAVMLEDKQECRFTLEGGANQLTYSYEVDQWSVWYATTPTYAPTDAVWWPAVSRYVHTSAAYGTNKEEPGQLYDNFSGHTLGVGQITNIQVQMLTSWLKVNSIEGFQRVRWLYMSGAAGSSTPDGNVTLTAYFDEAIVTPPYQGSYTTTFDAGDYIPTTGAPFDFRHKLRRQKCKSIAFLIVDDSNLAGWQAFQLQIGVKRGTNKLPAARGIG